MFYIIPEMQNNSLYIDNLRTFWCYQPRIDLPGTYDTELFDNDRIDFKLENISFMYGNKLVLNNINMKINSGEKVAIVGNNGAGKSTLLRLLLRLYEPIEGKIYINDKNIKRYDLDKYRNNIVSIFQDHQLFAYSIAENILLRSINSTDDEKKVKEALKKVDLFEKVMNLPNNIYTKVSKEFDNEGIIFSGGEMQRLMLARIFASEAKVIIMDEPTSNLDNYAEYNVINNIFKEFKDRTIIIICHKLVLTKLVDNIIVISDGKIEEEGNFSNLISKNGFFAQQYKIEVNEYEKLVQY